MRNAIIILHVQFTTVPTLTPAHCATTSTEAAFPLWPNQNITTANCLLTGPCETFV